MSSERLRLCDDERVSAEALTGLCDYLDVMILDARKAHAVAQAAARIEPGIGQEEMATYWSNVASGLRWAKGRALRSARAKRVQRRR